MIICLHITRTLDICMNKFKKKDKIKNKFLTKLQICELRQFFFYVLIGVMLVLASAHTDISTLTVAFDGAIN